MDARTIELAVIGELYKWWETSPEAEKYMVMWENPIFEKILKQDVEQELTRLKMFGVLYSYEWVGLSGFEEMVCKDSLLFVPSSLFGSYCSEVLLKEQIALVDLSTLNLHKLYCVACDIDESMQLNLCSCIELEGEFKNPTPLLIQWIQQRPLNERDAFVEALNYMKKMGALNRYVRIDDPHTGGPFVFEVYVRIDPFRKLKADLQNEYDKRHGSASDQKETSERQTNPPRASHVVKAEIVNPSPDIMDEVSYNQSSEQKVQEKVTTLHEDIPKYLAIFRKEADVWRILFAGKTIFLKDTLGLRYIYELLKKPRKEFDTLELLQKVQSNKTDDGAEIVLFKEGELGDMNMSLSSDDSSSEVIDEQAKMEYEKRIKQLHEKIECADKVKEKEVIQEMKQELNDLQSFLKKNTGLRGKSRKFASPSEQARTSIRNAIMRSLEKIKECNMPLYEYFKITIKTGYECMYQPPSENYPQWVL